MALVTGKVLAKLVHSLWTSWLMQWVSC